MQARALGSRIATILRTREIESEAERRDSKDGASKKPRKHKVIVHTSPFVRCVQTSVALSSGLSQNAELSRSASYNGSPSRPSTAISDLHSSTKTASSSVGTPLDTILEPASSDKSNGKKPEENPKIKKSMLRVDAFLGEWLTPEYFEMIRPPPPSVSMVAGAKAELLKREDYSNLDKQQAVLSKAFQPFPGGWGSPVSSPIEKEVESPLATLGAMPSTLPMHKRDRASTFSSTGSSSSSRSPSLLAPTLAEPGTYMPPIPISAISNSDPIPQGYVAHARDACVDVDYQWDSMRPPQEWGDGGEYGEEWSQMHRRFRRGLSNLMHWYRDHDGPDRPATRRPSAIDFSIPVGVDDDDEENTDLVVILVTHGAGCNALIGALTNQPVLLDVGMASLTMAVRKESTKTTPKSTPCGSPKSHATVSLRTLPVHEEYDVKMVADTEHLRPSTANTPLSRTPLRGMSPWRQRNGSNGNIKAPFIDPARSSSMSANLGSMRRGRDPSVTSIPSNLRNYKPLRTSSIGLWSSTRSTDGESSDTESNADDNMMLNFGRAGSVTDLPPLDIDSEDGEPVKPKVRFSEVSYVEPEPRAEESEPVAPKGGLWGSPRTSSPNVSDKFRDTTPKRRWTINEKA